MTNKLKRNLRGVVEPFLLGEPLFVRLCSAFVSNLALILRTAFIVGAILLFQEFSDLSADLREPLAEIEPAPVAHEFKIELISEPEPQDPVLTERVQHFLNCTYEDYRSAHFDECVESRSDIYPRPQAEPDESGRVRYDAPVRYARLDGHFGLDQTREPPDIS